MSAVDPQEPVIVDGEVISLAEVMSRPPQYPPAVRPMCACGKDGTPYSHGADAETGHRALTCAEVLEIRARVEAAQAPRRRVLRRFLSWKR